MARTTISTAVIVNEPTRSGFGSNLKSDLRFELRIQKLCRTVHRASTLYQPNLRLVAILSHAGFMQLNFNPINDGLLNAVAIQQVAKSLYIVL